MLPRVILLGIYTWGGLKYVTDDFGNSVEIPEFNPFSISPGCDIG